MDFEEAAEKILAKSKVKPTIGLILGSGLGYLTGQFEDAISVDYGEIESFPRSTVEGHRGRFVVGRLSGEAVIAMDGRFHFYEGHAIQDVVKPIYIFKEMGIERLIVTNAAGGINRSFIPGDIVAITDVINFSFNNPLIGPNKEEYGVRFPDMSSVIDREWLKKVERISKSADIDMKQGTYIFVTGPSYETPAEIKAYESFGADMVGMSTVPELIAASHCKIKALAFSCITNMASGILDKKLDHHEVVETAQKVRSKFSKIVTIALNAFKEEKL
ncbi:purine nucleoside phosphorylase [Kosmotoga arenicorallina S304]|uniref:Purine nucleoside phosphorylase n=1 Tax=Kosmotoga arenicorallina S304 TaxID=1453497 RepID=A0A182C794_9BACT|nr:purine-nucleoside phosphorylase [Kosmotoga arenicorallina]OAA31395.1 purine nucleoside phosphorylase [Kosmotoga arenicorallina S304]